MSGEESNRVRKTRSDKKRDVQPTILLELKDCIYRISYITDTPVKDVAENLCAIGVTKNKVLSHLSNSFRRDIRIDNTLYIGEINRKSNRGIITGRTERITIRFKSDLYEVLSVLSYALDCSVARTCGMLLDACVRDVEILNEIIGSSLKRADENKMKELKKVFEYINVNNPYGNEIKWTDVVKFIMSETKESVKKVSSFVVEHWRDEK